MGDLRTARPLHLVERTVPSSVARVLVLRQQAICERRVEAADRWCKTSKEKSVSDGYSKNPHTYKNNKYIRWESNLGPAVVRYLYAICRAPRTAPATHLIPIRSVATCTELHGIRLWFLVYWETSESPPQDSSRKPAFLTHINLYADDSAKVTSFCLRCMIAIRVRMSVETSYPVS